MKAGGASQHPRPYFNGELLGGGIGACSPLREVQEATAVWARPGDIRLCLMLNPSDGIGFRIVRKAYRPRGVVYKGTQVIEEMTCFI